MRPQVIIALGNAALQTLTHKSGIKANRGKELPLHASYGYDCAVWPSYHPAMVGYQPMTRHVIVADLRRIRDRGLAQTPINWTRLRAGETLIIPPVAAVDIETFDEDGAITDAPTQAAIYSGTLAHVLDRAQLVRLDPIQFPITHNGWRFDLPKLGWPINGRDTLVMAYLCDETQPLGLEALCVKYLGVRGWKEDRDAFLGTDGLAMYNARDAIYTLRLYHKLLEELGPRIAIADRIILPGYLALLDCSKRGIWIDGDEVECARVEVTAIVEETKAALQTAVGFAVDEKGRAVEFNPNSTDQIVRYLESIGFDFAKRTPTGRKQLDKAVLEEMIEATPGPFLDTLKRYKEATKTLSTYINPYAAAAASDDHRMHNEYTAWNTVVGRTSARGANVQNLDRDYKSFFSAPPGALAVEADYSALHFRLAAFNASEATIIERYREDPNWDPHLFFGRLFYGRENITPLERQIAKSGNFSQLYMGEAHTLQTYAKGLGISLSMRTCRELHETWHIAFPGFRSWYVAVMDELLANGYVETVTGRRRHFGDVRKMSRIGRQGALREAVNFKVLGLEPDIALLALAECHTGGLPINYFGHDAIRFEFPSRVDYDNHKHLIRPCMIDRPLAILRDEFGVNLTVPLEIEIKLYDA